MKFVIAAAAGVTAALRLKRRRPAAYAGLAASTLRRRTTATVTRSRVPHTGRYCLVGAGPAGMVMTRALLDEGVQFDWYERGSDFGGIWDIDQPGSPMYSSAHFISSRYTSGFYGHPMPADLPDYPSWRQIRDYLRGFGSTFGLYDHVTFNTEVTSADQLTGDRWSVTLSDGRRLEYQGLICAPGVTGHPNRPVLEGQDRFKGGDPTLGDLLRRRRAAQRARAHPRRRQFGRRHRL